MEQKYPALRTISSLYKVIAVLAFILALLVAALLVYSQYQLSQSSFYANSPASILSAVFMLVVTIFSGVLISVSLYAFANLIDLMIDTEENTRATAVLLNRLLTRRQSNE